MQTNKAIAFVSIVVVIALALYAGYRYNVQEPSSPPPDQDTGAVYGTEEARRSLLDGLAVIEFPNILKTAPAAALPEDLSYFAHQSAMNIEILSLTYANGKTGFRTSFDLPMSLRTAYSFYSRLETANPAWQVLAATRGNTYAFVDATDGASELRVDIGGSMDGETCHIQIDTASL